MSSDGSDAPYFPPPRARAESAPSIYREPQRVPPIAPVSAPSNPAIVSRPEPPESTSSPRKTPVKPDDGALSIEARMARDHTKTSLLANEWAARFAYRFGISIAGVVIVFIAMQLMGKWRVFDSMRAAPWLAMLLVPFVIVGSIWLLVWRIKRLVKAVQRTFDE
jgi:hypothetical protein